MKILIMGPPGSGKTTVGRLLGERLNITFVSVGGTLRELPENYPYYKEIKEAMDKGVLAPFDLVASVLKVRLSRMDCSNGFILDGWARNMENLKYFDPHPDKAILLMVSKDTVSRRILGRRVCKKDNKVCNIYTLPPSVEGNCDSCGTELKARDDDNEEVVKNRIGVFEQETYKVIEHFKNRGILMSVDGERLPNEIVDNICYKFEVEQKQKEDDQNKE